MRTKNDCGVLDNKFYSRCTWIAKHDGFTGGLEKSIAFPSRWCNGNISSLHYALFACSLLLADEVIVCFKEKVKALSRIFLELSTQSALGVARETLFAGFFLSFDKQLVINDNFFDERKPERFFMFFERESITRFTCYSPSGNSHVTIAHKNNIKLFPWSIDGSFEEHAHERALEEKTVEDVGEFAVRLYISSPTVFQIRSKKEKFSRRRAKKNRENFLKKKKFIRENSEKEKWKQQCDKLWLLTSAVARRCPPPSKSLSRRHWVFLLLSSMLKTQKHFK